MGFRTQFKLALHDFLDTTTARGVPRTVRSRTKLLKALWTLAVLTGIALGVLQVVALVQDYFTYPTVNELNYLNLNTSNREFPAITLCNLNPFPTDTSNYVDVHTRKEYFAQMEHFLKENGVYGKEKWFTEMFLSDQGYFESLTLDESRKVGHNQTNFIIHCSWFGFQDGVVGCTEKANVITLVQNPDFFNCYTINPNSTDVLLLDMMLFLDNFDTDISLRYNLEYRTRESRGVRVALHGAGTYPPFYEDFIEFSPGQYANFIIDTHKFQLMPPPYGDCHENPYNGDDYRYTRTHCQMQCTSKAVVDADRCIFSLYYDMVGNYSFPFCRSAEYIFKDDDIINISNRAFSPYLTAADIIPKCECALPCEYVDFKTKTGSTKWPSKSHVLGVYETYIKGSPQEHLFSVYEPLITMAKVNESEALKELEKISLIEDNYVRLRFQFKNNVLTAVSTKKKYDLVSLLSRIGGTINFYSGITMLLAIELLELIINTVIGSRSVSNSKVQSINVEPLEIKL